MFPALYLAADKGTALAEVLGRDKGADSLTPEELALTNPDSISAVSVSGRLDAILDIRGLNNLAEFVNLINVSGYPSRWLCKRDGLAFLCSWLRRWQS